MPAKHLRPIPFDSLLTETIAEPAPWLWHGYLMPGEVTLLTSQWKSGKTTLLTGLIRALATGTPFLDRPTRPARVWVVSEETQHLWRDRLGDRPFGPHAHLLARPFRKRPTPDDWSELIDTAVDARTAGELDLFALDPLASFLPGRCESDGPTLLEALHPLYRLTTAGAAVLLLHHPRKKPSEAGSSARGSSALLGFADVLMEMSRSGRLKTDAYRRQLFARSRRPDTPERVLFEWDRSADLFRVVPDLRERQFMENWTTVERILRDRVGSMMCAEIAANWPADTEPPATATLYAWLHAAHAKKLLTRNGRGTKTHPYRFRLRTKEDDEYDRFQLPPLPPLRPLMD